MGCKYFSLCINQTLYHVFGIPSMHHTVEKLCILVTILQPSYTRLSVCNFFPQYVPNILSLCSHCCPCKKKKTVELESSRLCFDTHINLHKLALFCLASHHNEFCSIQKRPLRRRGRRVFGVEIQEKK